MGPDCLESRLLLPLADLSSSVYLYELPTIIAIEDGL